MQFDYTKHNVGNTDSLIRTVVGTLFLVVAVLGGSWIAGLIGVVALGTAYFRFCPAYALFSFSSKKDAAPVAK
jgi:hypothetical protein